MARKGNYNFDTCDIVMKCLQKAERKVDEWMEKHKEHAKVSMNGTSDKEIQCMANYTSSDTEANSGN